MDATKQMLILNFISKTNKISIGKALSLMEKNQEKGFKWWNLF